MGVARRARAQPVGSRCTTPRGRPEDPTLRGARRPAHRPDFIFSFYFRHMIPARVLTLAPRGALNLHGSLLPRYRGRAPVNWVLVNGETRDRRVAAPHGRQARRRRPGRPGAGRRSPSRTRPTRSTASWSRPPRGCSTAPCPRCATGARRCARWTWRTAPTSAAARPTTAASTGAGPPCASTTWCAP